MKESSQVRENFYGISLTLESNGAEPAEVFFKAGRYSPYCGRLQVARSIKECKRFKTHAGARSAIERLKSKGVIKPQHLAVVVHFVEMITQRFSYHPGLLQEAGNDSR